MANKPDPADFMPGKGTYKDLKPFRFWCQKVLPLVYDDSLSYYELLCKVVDYLNNAMADVELLMEDFGKLYDTVGELQDYINAYFDSLDVQEEVNAKLDEMASDGSLEALVEPLLPSMVSDWLAENLGPTTPPVDKTLTIDGAAADALATGEELTALKDDLDNVYKNLIELTSISYEPVPDKNGYIRYTQYDIYAPGEVMPINNNANAKYTDFINVNGALYAKCRAMAQPSACVIAFYDAEKQFILEESVPGISNSAYNDYTHSVPVNAEYVRFSNVGSGSSEFECCLYGNYEWNIANEINKTIREIGTRQTTGADILTDFDEADNNRIYAITSLQGVSNYPVNLGGTLITFNGASQYKNTQVQMYITTRNTIFTRTYINNVWTSWSRFTVISDTIVSHGGRIAAGSTDLTDYNDALPNHIYTITTVLAHSPASGLDAIGTLLTANGAIEYANGQFQWFVSQTGKTFSRMLWANTWTDWKEYVDQSAVSAAAITQTGERQTESASVLTDLNNALPNKIYTITYPVSNCPDSKIGTLITYNGDTHYPGGQVQIFTAHTGEVYTRILWGGSGGQWTPWQQTENGSTSCIYSGIELFEKFGVIGDSFASGVIYTPEVTTDREHWELSWVQILARMSGSTGVNYTRGGINTKEWLTNSAIGMPKLLSDIQTDGACGLYILCLGINDSNNTRTPGGLTYLGSISDIDDSDYTQNADTFYGNYGKIIQMIQEATPESRIIMCNFKRIPTEATSEGYDAFRAAILDIANHFGLPYIKLDDDVFFNSSFYMNKMVGSHPTGPQYVGYAKAIERLVSKAIVDNYNYFKEYVGV